MGLLSVRPGKHFWGVKDLGIASLSASRAPPPNLESLLVQWAPVWLNSVWSKYSLETFCLPGIRDHHPHISCSNAAGDSMWQIAEIPPEGIGISTVMSFFSPPVAIYPAHTKSRAILSRHFFPAYIHLHYCGKTQFQRSFTQQSLFSGSSVLKILLWKNL